MNAQAEDAQLSARMRYGSIGHFSNAQGHFCSVICSLSSKGLASLLSWALWLSQGPLTTAALEY